jgi:quercetin dioxygenase-like cupin family protein
MSDAAIPADDPARQLTVADPNTPAVRHVAVVGDTYSILVSGAETAGRYCLIDMIVPDGGGPPPHRHDFEEMFTLLEGELEFAFRGRTTTVRAGSTVSVPANAPHAFRNASGAPVHMLCLAAPAGWKNSFSKSAIRWRAARRRPPSSTTRRWKSGSRRSGPSPRNTAPNS